MPDTSAAPHVKEPCLIEQHPAIARGLTTFIVIAIFVFVVLSI